MQARNQMEFRSILYIIIAIVSLFFQVLLSKLWGGVGCAIAVSGALIIGQIIIMNIYYSRKQYIEISRFWKEIFKMSIVPISLGSIVYVTNQFYSITTWWNFLISCLLFSIIYIPLFIKFSLNENERKLLIPILKKI